MSEVPEVGGAPPTAPVGGSPDAGGAANPPAPTPKTPSTGFLKRVREAAGSGGPDMEAAAREAATGTPSTGSTDENAAPEGNAPEGSSPKGDAPAPEGTSPGRKIPGRKIPGEEVGSGTGDAAPEHAANLRGDAADFSHGRDEKIADMEAQIDRMEDKLADGPIKVLGIDLSDAMEGSLEERRREVDAQRALATLSTVSYALGADEEMVDTITNIEDVNVEAAEDMTSDAYYDSESNEATYSDTSIEEILNYAGDLQEAGILDEDLQLVPGSLTALDTAAAANEIAKMSALTAHEIQVHDGQDADGTMEETNLSLQEGIEAAASSAEDQAYIALEKERILSIELPAYNYQEHAQYGMGAAARTFVTINPDGTDRPADEAVDRIFNLEVYGTPDPTAEDLASVDAAARARELVEGQLGGESHGEPTGEGGYDSEGRKIPASEVEGRKIPAFEVEGRKIPGYEIEGRKIPAFEVEGRKIPGSEIEGRKIPGSVVA